MRDIRVLVTDDSAVIRRLISDVINGEAGMTVAGTAENGRIAVERVAELKPDVVTLDIEMPEMNGIEALSAIRKTNRAIPIIMFSTLTVGGGAATLDALSKGASDFVTKPSGPGGLTNSLAQIRAELVPKIRALATRLSEAPRTPAAAAPPVVKRPSTRPGGRVDAVVIAVSTGGPRALEDIVPMFPADFGVPILAVQHMPATFTRLLAERLDRMAQISVHEAGTRDEVLPGHMYIAPGEHHLVVKRAGATTITALTDDPPEHSCRPAADVLFRSAVKIYGGNVLGVVLTGMGEDGSGGARAVCDAGGRVIVQDKATSVVWGMPGTVVNMGLADAELPLAKIVPEIVRSVGSGRAAASRARAGGRA